MDLLEASKYNIVFNGMTSGHLVAFFGVAVLIGIFSVHEFK